MATGDDALEAGMAVMTGAELANTLDDEVNLTRDYIAQHTAGMQPTIADVSAATPSGELDTSAGKLVRFSGGGSIGVKTPSSPNGVTPKSYVDGKVAKTGDTMTGDLKLPNATAATSGYVVAYINGDGRVSRNASSRRFKKHIRRPRADQIPDVFAVPLAEFEWRGGDGTRIFGRIAEDLIGTPMERFVIVDAEGRPAAIDDIQLLIVQVAVLQARVAQLEQNEKSPR